MNCHSRERFDEIFSKIRTGARIVTIDWLLNKITISQKGCPSSSCRFTTSGVQLQRLLSFVPKPPTDKYAGLSPNSKRTMRQSPIFSKMKRHLMNVLPLYDKPPPIKRLAKTNLMETNPPQILQTFKWRLLRPLHYLQDRPLFFLP